MSVQPCITPRCGRPRRGRTERCRACYVYARRHDDSHDRPMVFHGDEVRRFWSKVDRRSRSECWIWTATVNNQGYGVFWVKPRNLLAHRYSWELHHNRTIPEKMSACHQCDTPPCVNPHHLFLGTHAENMADAKTKNRWPSKLTPQQRTEIMEAKMAGGSTKAIAEQYDISKTRVKQLARQARENS